MPKFRSLKFIFLVSILFSCGKDLPVLEGIDQQVWKDDRDGCDNKRSTMADALIKEKDKLLALDELQIVALLGRPDRNELFKRNQKFYYYFLEPSEECETHGESPLTLTIRFNAMGLAKEVMVRGTR